MKAFKLSTQATIIGTALLILTACGGGGGGGTATTDTSANSSNNGASSSSSNASGSSSGTSSTEACFTGTPSAAYVPDATTRVIHYGLTGDGSTSVAPFNLDANKALTSYGTATLTGNYCVKDMAGDSTYTMGRWRNGIASDTNGAGGKTVTLDLGAVANGSVFYFAFKRPSAAISKSVTTVINCTNMASTQAALVSGSASRYFLPMAISNGQLTLDSTGNVKIDFTATTTAGSTISNAYTTTARWLGTAYNSATMLGYVGVQGQSNAIGAVDVGTGLGNNVNVGGYYVFSDSNGAKYAAALSMTCPNP